MTRSGTEGDSQYDNSSPGLGTNDTTTGYSDSESDLETGSEFASDPAGGPALGGVHSHTSVTTSYA